MHIASKLLQQDLLKLAMWCAKWRIKLNPTKAKVIIFYRSILARKIELNLKLYGETLKIYPQVKFLGITFDSQLNFKKHFEEGNPGLLQYQVPPSKTSSQQKWGPSPATIIQITNNASVQFLNTALFQLLLLQTISSAKQNKLLQLALRLPKIHLL